MSDQHKLDQVLAEVRQLRVDLQVTLHGLPPEHKGLLVRLDRLEQRMGVLSRLWWIAASGAAAALAKLFVWK